MKNVGKIFIPLTLFGLFGCASVPPPGPLAPEMAAIGISVKSRAPVGLFTLVEKRVYFVRVDQEEDVYAARQFSLSNYAEGGQVYLLNVKPGRYAAVASFRAQERTPYQGPGEFTTVFPKQLIKLTEVTLAPGTIVFMGEYMVNTSTSFDGADDAQRHYFHLIAPGARPGVGAGVLSAMFSGEVKAYYKGSLREEKRDPEAESRFLSNALNHFKGTEWLGMVQKRLQDLKARR